jgi:hypothetical protein
MHTHFLFFLLFFIFLFFYFLFFYFFWVGSNSAHMGWAEPSQLSRSLAQASDPTGQKSKKARVK